MSDQSSDRPSKPASAQPTVVYSKEIGNWLYIHIPDEQELEPVVDLGKTSFPAVLCDHFHRSSTGRLTVTSGPRRKHVYLRSGQVIFSASSDRSDRLGEMLLRRGIVDLPGFLGASKALRPGKRLGMLLVERGFLSPGQLVWAVREQLKDIIFSLFTLDAGTSRFETAPVLDEVITLNLKTPELVRQGMARMESATRPLDAFPDPHMKFRLSLSKREVSELFDLDADEAKVVEALATGASLAELCKVPGLAHFWLLKFLWALRILGLLSEGRRVETPMQETSNPLADAVDLEVTGEDLKDLF